MSMYAVNAGVPKTLVKEMISWIKDHLDGISEKAKEILIDILDTKISPELLPPDEKGEIKQETENLIGDYLLHDFFLYYMIRHGFAPEKIYFLAKKAFKNKYSDEEIKKWLKEFVKRFFSNQFKRNCMPDAIKVGSVALSPRGDWRMPSDADYTIWMEDLV